MFKKAARNVLIVAAALIVGVIVAGSCSGGGGGSSVSSVCSAYCSQLEECDPGTFDDYYDDKAECKDDCVDENENYWADYEPSECKGEAMDLAICGYGIDCADYDDFETYLEECDNELVDLDDCLQNASSDSDIDIDTDADSDYDNVASCEDWLTAMGACEEYYASGFDCSTYADIGCDISDYFSCLCGYTYCDESTDPPTLDTTGWDNCTDLASC